MIFLTAAVAARVCVELWSRFGNGSMVRNMARPLFLRNRLVYFAARSVAHEEVNKYIKNDSTVPRTASEVKLSKPRKFRVWNKILSGQ